MVCETIGRPFNSTCQTGVDMDSYKHALFALIITFSLVSLARAGDGSSKSEKEEVARPGVLASAVVVGSNVAVQIDTASSGSAPGDAPNPISGSVSRVSDDTCVAKISNTGTRSYALELQVIGTNADGEDVFKDSFREKLKPGASDDHKVDKCERNTNLWLILKSAAPMDKL